MPATFSMPVAMLLGELRSAERLADWFDAHAADRWAAYVVGVAHACLVQRGASVSDRNGFRLLIESRVPEGKGVSSSAALEVACLSVIAARYGVELSGEELATAAQWAENHIARAPCGIMDQMTSACGQARPPAASALPARHGRGPRRHSAGLSILRNRFRNPARRHGRRLRHRANRRVHGLSHDRRPRRTLGDAIGVARADRRFALARLPREHRADGVRLTLRGTVARADDRRGVPRALRRHHGRRHASERRADVRRSTGDGASRVRERAGGAIRRAARVTAPRVATRRRRARWAR